MVGNGNGNDAIGEILGDGDEGGKLSGVGHCDSELGSYPGQVMRCQGS